MHDIEHTDTSLLFYMSDYANRAMKSFDDHWLFWAKTGLDASNQRRADLEEHVKRNPPTKPKRPTETQKKKNAEFWKRVMASKTYKLSHQLRKVRYQNKQLNEENAELKRRAQAHDQGCLDLYDEINQLISDLYRASIVMASATEEADLIKARDDGAEIRIKLKQLIVKLPVTT